MERNEELKFMQMIVDDWSIGLSVESLCRTVYRWLDTEGVKCCIVNDKYIAIGDRNFQFIKSRKQGRWIVKEF